ncbi:MAG: cation-transporting P-type ATPase [Cytophagaceae bacterium]|jgi:Ca2+-transporting ATPase|nr:cation-transporting P-type ATPase [Cytophagaceae bacterium]
MLYKHSLAYWEQQLQTSLSSGLSPSQAAQRLSEHGANQLLKKKRHTLLGLLWEQFRNLLVLLLLGASLLSFYLGSYRDGWVLLSIVVLNALIGFYQQWKSENILESLGNLIDEKCIVIREGRSIEIPARDLVPGDLVWMEEGEGVPADLRIVSATGLASNDFILTGESLPREKSPQEYSIELSSLSDWDNVLFMGTSIAKGQAKALVVATGMQTQLGAIADRSESIAVDDSPLQKEMNKLAYRITLFSFFIGMALFAFRIWQHDSISAALVFAISVAAAMVPSGLPAQISVALSLGVQGLAKRKAIVKQLSSVETLGSTTVIATDKTGTITRNEMTIHVARLNGMDYKITGHGFQPQGEIFDLHLHSLHPLNLGDRKIPFLAGYLASTAKVNPPDANHSTWHCIGDPTEGAFATLAMKAGYSLEAIDQEYSLLKIFPFDSTRKRISVLRKHHQKHILFVKGSVESILEVCSHYQDQQHTFPMQDAYKKHVLELATSYAAQGQRIIALAYSDVQDPHAIENQEQAERDLVFSGFVAMSDPPNDGIQESIQAAFAAGIRVVMITGDNEVTASSIAETIGMQNADGSAPRIIRDTQLQQLTDETLKEFLQQRTLIFSRVSPEEKLRIVRLLKDIGDVVAVTGDGVNDTLSLKQADIGIAMGRKGSKIAQEAASMVLLDDSFPTIVVAIEEGRTIYQNIRKNVKATLSSNLAELICVLSGFAGIYWELPTIILAIHILLIDLIGEMLPLLAISMDPAERNLMKQAPRKQGQMMNGRMMTEVFFSGILRGTLAVAAFFLVYLQTASDPMQHEKALTATMLTIILTQFVQLLCTRSSSPVWSSYTWSNPFLWYGIAASSALLLSMMYIPWFQVYLHTAPLLGQEWIAPAGFALGFGAVLEVLKKLKRKRS